MGKGNISTEYTVWCDRCVEWEQQAMARNKADAIRLFKAGGWVVRKGRWVCPECKRLKRKDTPDA